MKIRQIHIVLATTLFAILVWFSVSMSENYQYQVSAPLVITDLPAGKALAGSLPRTVKLTFNDSGWRLAKVAWGPGLEWKIDFNTLPARHQALTLRDFADQIGGSLGIQPIAMYPESLFVSLEPVSTRRVPIAPRCDLSFPAGFGQVGPVVVKPESVTVTGARSMVNQIQSWPTAPRAFPQVRQDIDAILPLSDTLPQLEISPDRVRIRINVQQFAEKTFPSLPVEFASVPQNRQIILSSPRIELVVRGGIGQLAGLTQNNIRVIVDYRDILSDTSGIIEPTIVIPSGLRVVKKTPDRLQYVVRKK